MKSAVQKVRQRRFDFPILDKETSFNDESAIAGLRKRDLLVAFRREQFVPYYQPKLDIQTGKPIGVEILGRWLHPELGTLLPNRFITLLERFGLIDEFTECLLVQSLALASDFATSGKGINLALNVSALSLRDESLCKLISGIVKESGISPDRFTIELTETAQPDASTAVVDSLTSLRLQGFHISIDDFGTGYSSLKQLTKFPFTELKIDRIFVNDARSRPKVMSVLETIVELARKLQLRTVAEGIETEEELVLLQSLGCDMAQGFLFAHPMPQKMLETYLQQLSRSSATCCSDL